MVLEATPGASALPAPTTAAGILIATTTVVLLHFRPFRSSQTSVAWQSVLFPVLLAALSVSWLLAVSFFVPEPYLDEVFHVPQAQKYCQGRFREWDDKITTPPGLYMLSIGVPGISNALGATETVVCDAQSLRAVNVIGLLLLSYLALICRHRIEASLHEEHSNTKLDTVSQYALHTAFNIGLFPLLFFFSGLHYTDVLSTAVVLLAYSNHLFRVRTNSNSFISDVYTLVLGVAALLMRQTNIFWVVVFMGGLEAVHAVKTLQPERVDQPFMPSLWEHVKFYVWRYSVGDIHDLPVNLAWLPIDYAYTAMSLLIAGVANPLRVGRQIWPYVALMGMFAGFVSWNGGVVLGDKSNHVATLHLAQMLYIWPLFAFFSAPLVIHLAVPEKIVAALGRCTTMLRKKTPQPAAVKEQSSSRPARRSSKSESSEPVFKSSRPTSKASRKRRSPPGASKFSAWQETRKMRITQISRTLYYTSNLCASPFPWIAYLVATIILSLAIVKFNTIIHPFTLADNRHYMFYVFRYTIRRAGLTRYWLVVSYTLCRWLLWWALSGCSPGILVSPEEHCSTHYKAHGIVPPYTSNPLWINMTDVEHQPRGTYPKHVPALSPAESRAAQEAMRERQRRDPLAFSAEAVPTSTAMIFLLATTLSLITAPLVEPRYFIIPWVLWRLMVPAWRLHSHGESDSPLYQGLRDFRAEHPQSFLFRYDLRLVLETVWFVLINLVTGYIFLFKPFTWRAEDGSVLDDGRLQRFMW